MTQSDLELLQSLLRLEHAAVHGYGRLGAFLPADARGHARLLVAAHRAARDILRATLRARDAEPVPAEVAYELPVAVRDGATALAAAVALEERGETGYHAAVSESDEPAVRFLAASGLVQAATHAAQWRLLRGERRELVAEPFPGRA